MAAPDEPPRPNIVDAEYRPIYGPWPRWMLHVGLVELSLTAAAVVVCCLLLTLALLVAMGVFG
jgi:hypothetical protein